MDEATKVLVISRNPSLRETAVELLLRGGYEADEASDAKSALASWGQDGGRPGWVLLDGTGPVAQTRELLDELAVRRTSVVLLADDTTRRPVRTHHAVHEVVEAPWTLRKLMKLVDVAELPIKAEPTRRHRPAASVTR